MTQSHTFNVGDTVFLGWGEYSSDRPADISALPRLTELEAWDDAAAWFGWLSEREQATASYGVTRYRAVSLADDGSVSSMVSY